MAVTRPSLLGISHLLSRLSGQQVWGIAWSIAGFTIEIGKERFEPDRHRRCGEVGIFILCFWQLKTPDGRLLSAHDDRNENEWTALLRSHMENKPIRSASIEAESHKLLLTFEDGVELGVLPDPGRRGEEGWTIFYFAEDGKQHWCSLNGTKIHYDD